MASTNNELYSVRREQMSISAITSNQMPRFSPQQYSGVPNQHYRIYRPSNNPQRQEYHHLNTRPTSSPPKREHFMNSPPSSPQSFDYSKGSFSSQTDFYKEDDDQSVKSSCNLSLEERRQRNKAASAKYRLKKNVQQHEMRSMIGQLSERNKLLERQLREVQEENRKLRTATDKLRGKFVAKKLLRQWIGYQKQLSAPAFSNNKDGVRMLQPPPDIYAVGLLSGYDIDDSLESLCSGDI